MPSQIATVEAGKRGKNGTKPCENITAASLWHDATIYIFRLCHTLLMYQGVST